MDKKSVDMDNRSELLGKVEIKDGSKKKVNKKVVDVDLNQTIALDEVLRVTNPKKYTEEEKRSELLGKFNGKKKKLSNKEDDRIERIRKAIEELENEDNELEKESNSKEIEILSEQKIEEDIVEEIKEVKKEEVIDKEESMKEDLEDKVQENVENVSVAMIVLILLGCFVVGGILGYLLYKVAIDNSNVLSVMFKSLF